MIVCFVICPNGFGHLYRSIDVINSLNKERKIEKIYIICSKEHKKKLKNFNEFKNKIFIKSTLPNLDLKINPYVKLLKFYNFNLDSSILKKSDLIFSDNLININLPHYKTVFISNFFWGDVYKNANKQGEYSKLEKNFFNERVKFILANRYFFIKNKFIKSKIIKIGFTKFKKNKFYKRNKSNKFLIYFGKNDIIPNKQINSLKKSKYKIYTFNKALSKKHSFVTPLVRKTIDYDRFKFTLTKPGLGSIRDLLINKSIPIFYFRSNNYEYKMNYLNIKKKLKFAININNKSDIYKLINNEKFKNEIYLYNYNHFKFDGNECILKFIKNYEK